MRKLEILQGSMQSQNRKFKIRMKAFNTKLDAFKKNTMSLEDALIDASLVIQNPGASILENRIVSVTKDAKEISTLTHGRCMIFDLKRKVDIILKIKLQHINIFCYYFITFGLLFNLYISSLNKQTLYQTLKFDER